MRAVLGPARGWRRILKREMARLLAWAALLLVLPLYPVLVTLLAGIAWYGRREAAGQPRERRNGSAPP
ncbi:MAG: hypothetical protein HY509_00175 [Acidobacteria bacterium]|nr:hypothetical protein [Acidobacteriota bacterium]